jgi:osmotically-inducible protein OsmY
MDKHYGWQEGRGSQSAGGGRNGQRWNERSQNDDRDMRSGRGGDFGGGWDQNEGRWASGGDLDREDYMSNDEEYGGQSRGGYGSRGQSGWSQGGSNRGQSSQFGGGQWGGGQGFSGGHYGGFANEGYPGQGNYGGNRGFSNQGYSGQRYNQGSSRQGGGFSGQSGQNWGQTFGQGSRGQSYGYQGRGFSGKGPKGYQRSDDRIKEQLSDRLMDDDDIDASEITIEVKNGEATLTGTVGSREEKRAAEEIAEQSPGVREVQNLLRVQAASSSSSQSGQGQPGRTSTTPGQKRNTERE